MKPVKTERSNLIYRGNGGQVQDLHCERAEVKGGGLDGGNVVYAVWEPTDEEREALAAGANIKVGIYFMEPIPPTSVQVTRERTDDE